MTKIIYTFLSFSVLFLFLIQKPAKAQDNKAQLILEIAKGITWTDAGGDFTIGVLDDKALDKALTTLTKDQSIGNRKIVIKRYSFNFQVKVCNILFLSTNSVSNTFFNDIKRKVRGSQSLIITESSGLLEEGSHINLVNTTSGLGFEMNQNLIEQNGMTVSAALAQKAVQTTAILKEEPEKKDLNLKDLKLFKKKDRNKKTTEENNEKLAEEEEETAKTGEKAGRKKENSLLDKVARDKEAGNQRMQSLLRYIAALEKKLDENRIDYQNLKKQYEEEQEVIAEEIKELNLTIIEKDSLRKKDSLLAQRKIELINSQKKIAQAHARSNLYLAVFASLVALILLGASFIFYRNSQMIKKQRNELSEKVEEINQQKEEIESQRDQIEKQKNVVEEEKLKSEKLLLNILPEATANELKEKGFAIPKQYEMASVLFTDFKGFSQIAEKLSPEEVIKELDRCFLAFDEIAEKHQLERIKTIGDSYMCVGGVPNANNSNPEDAVRAGLEIQEFMKSWKAEKIAKGEAYFECRLGIHTGKVVAGVVGKKKFAYDIWGDTVNMASRMESSGEVDAINISGETHELIKDKFDCEYRGKIPVKNRGEVDMYFVKKAKV